MSEVVLEATKNPGKIISGVAVSSLTFLTSLALNQALQATFLRIFKNVNPLPALWTYTMIVVLVSILIIILITLYLEPSLSTLFVKPNDNKEES